MLNLAAIFGLGSITYATIQIMKILSNSELMDKNERSKIAQVCLPPGRSEVSETNREKVLKAAAQLDKENSIQNEKKEEDVYEWYQRLYSKENSKK